MISPRAVAPLRPQRIAISALFALPSPANRSPNEQMGAAFPSLGDASTLEYWSLGCAFVVPWKT